ncbi:MAG: DUF488 domain-containing protein [Flaviflexus sp.]|uniref:DUF488 domain-containing protein n=1 Tax=Flaviflexus sp. TaxID=1969482 RepID=UPI003F8FD2FE
MPTPFPQEFREDVVHIVLNRDPGVTRDDIAKDFGIHVGTLDKCLREARAHDSHEPAPSKTENAELRELRQRNTLLEQEAHARFATEILGAPEGQLAIHSLAEFASGGTVIVLCYESDHSQCHRSLVIREVSELLESKA